MCLHVASMKYVFVCIAVYVPKDSAMLFHIGHSTLLLFYANPWFPLDAKKKKNAENYYKDVCVEDRLQSNIYNVFKACERKRDEF